MVGYKKWLNINLLKRCNRQRNWLDYGISDMGTAVAAVGVMRIPGQNRGAEYSGGSGGNKGSWRKY